MLFTYFLTALLPVASTAPVQNRNPESYNCGYLLTEHNSNSYAGIYAHDYCESIYYNQTISDYEDAYAYHIFGGCGSEASCMVNMDDPIYTGPTQANKAVDFAEPKPKWYICWKQI
ncbi:hypothetical protein EK21DRAFT_60600 [Setomelanomma holmii]|uniref:Uncharacterized protein n=1 Tax=Setomelanomma holmii TaxID=210430 RepID=A0A9P4LQA1_9PLEO|nr:hypothetical protein EK21DRAFT_60600 [Setomelanomma holmii]